MDDIWHNLATGLDGDVHDAIQKLRESSDFVAMGSEIERAFAAEFVLMLRIHGLAHEVSKKPAEKCGFFLIPQYEIGRYRVDFLFGHSSDKFELRKAIAIECDGHDWHERTKDQAARDKKRDRFLQQNFGAVLHFTGSEIYRNMAECLSEVGETMTALGKRGK